ncbi:MAG TPA: hypothetical protein VH054_04795, partial [Polyangiaceae bacterium]|nr:hypothetical protein [Polyangiaceae bacterium]
MIKKLAAVFVLSISSAALAAPRNAAQETAIDEDVAAVDPSLVATLHDGNAAMDRGDAKAAMRAYETVHAKAPIAAVARRLCTAEARAGEPELAAPHCREAVRKQDSSAENHAALAMAILANPKAGTAELLEARDEALWADRLAPDSEFAQTTLCAVALRNEDLKTLDVCSARLRKIAPRSPETHVYTAFANAKRNELDAADAELAAARDAGLDATAYAQMHDQLEKLRPKLTTLQKVVASATTALAWTIAAWIGAVFVLLVLGMLLSDAATRRPSRTTRGVYRLVVAKSVAMFYVSAVLGVLVLAIGIVVVAILFLAIVHATLPVEAAFGAVAIYVAIAAVRGLVGGPTEEEALGLRVELDDNERLRKALDAIAKRAKMDRLDGV